MTHNYEYTNHTISVKGGNLTAWSIGQGQDIIFLHGGPGDTHDYMKRMAMPLFNQYRCIFFDQRGTGQSYAFKRTPDLFKLEVLLEDLLAILQYFDSQSPILIGHSWGAMYALFSCIQFPTKIKKAGLISIGPLDHEAGKAVSEHLTSVLNPTEKEIWNQLRIKRNFALENSDSKLIHDIDQELMKLRVKAWVFNSKLREAFLNEYFQDPPPDREINKLIWTGAEKWFSWDKLKNVSSQIWLCMGENDSVPYFQTKKILKLIPTSKVTLYENCGHIPWFETPHRFYSDLQAFLI